MANTLPAECSTEPIVAQAVGFACPSTYAYIYDVRQFLTNGFGSGAINYLSQDGSSNFTVATVSQETGSFANALVIMLDSGVIWRVVQISNGSGSVTLDLEKVYGLNQSASPAAVKAFWQFDATTIL